MNSVCWLECVNPKAVRRSVLAKLKELEVKKPKLPDFTNPYESALAWASEYKAKEEALLGKAEAEHKLVIAAPKINHYDTLVEKTNLVNATQVLKLVYLLVLE